MAGQVQEFLAARRGGRKKPEPPTLEDLRAQVAELEAESQATGAPGIDEDKPGLFTKIIDVLSRPNYATAGFVEELLNGKSVTSGLARAFNELLSGVGPLDGQKRAFGEVLEHQGVGTKTMADAFPLLDGTWVGAMGSRGALGLGLDVVTDPLTYVTLGAGGAVKFAGVQAVKPGVLSKVFKEPVVKALSVVPGGERAMQAAAEMGAGMRRGINSLFHPYNELGNLPPELKGKAIRLADNFMNASAAHRARIHGIVDEGLSFGPEMPVVTPGLAKRYQRLAKDDPEIGKKFYEHREKTKLHKFTPEQRLVYDEFSTIHDMMAETLTSNGIFDQEDLISGYFFHGYKNIEDLDAYHFAVSGPFRGEIKETFTKERAFSTFDESVSKSKTLNKLSKAQRVSGVNARLYPELVPEYDLLGNFNRYIDQYADALARKSWHEQAVATFGKSIGNYDVNALYEISRALLRPSSKEYERVVSWFAGRKGFNDLVESAQEILSVSPLGEIDIFTGLTALSSAGLRTIRSKFAPTGKATGPVREIARAAPAEPLRPLPRGAGGETLRKSDELTRPIILGAGGEAPYRVSKVTSIRSPAGFQTQKKLGEALAEKVKRGEPFGGEELLKAREIIEAHKSQVEELLGRKLKLSRYQASREDATTALFRDADRLLSSLSSDGKREFMRRMILQSKSIAHVAEMTDQLWGKYSEFFPKLRSVVEGEADTSYAKMFGSDAEYIPVKSKFTGDNGVMIPRIIWEDMQKVSSSVFNTRDWPAFAKLLRGFDFFNNTFKLGVYSFWPASLTRDMYSNVALSMLDIGVGAVNPKSHLDTIGVMAGRKGTLVANGGLSYEWTDLRTMAKDMGVWIPGEVFAELTGHGARGRLGTVERGLKKVARVRGLVENEARMQLWIQNIRRGVSPRDAADHVSEFLFNYGRLSRFERDVMRRLIPFYTFTRKNIELQAKMLTRNPGMVINQIKPFRGYNSEDEEMVSFEGEALKLRLDRDGRTLHAITGIDLPLRNLDNLWAGGFGETGRRWMGMLTPLVRAPLQAVANRDFFTGRDLGRQRGDTFGRVIEASGTPKAVKDWLGYRKEYDDAGRPQYTFDGMRYSLLVQSWMFSRIVSTSDRQFREYAGDQTIQRAMLDLLTGMREKTINLDEQQALKLRRRVQELEQSLVRRGARQQFTRSYTRPGGQLQ